ncbi:class I SAM-dependent methyltransferase [Roseomonas sp. GCM10028921]
MDLMPDRVPVQAPSWIEMNAQSITEVLLGRLGLADTAAARARFEVVVHPVRSTGESFFDAEEELFLERWGITNEAVHTRIGPVYLAGRHAPDSEAWLAVRIANRGPFALCSQGTNPFALSYHWMRGAECIHYEGLRSGLQLALQPGRELTTHLRFHTPAEPGRYTLRIVPLVEGVAWFEDQAVEVAVQVGAPGSVLPRDETQGIQFSEEKDTEQATQFVERHLRLGPDAVVAEIGGGIRPLFQRCGASRMADTVLINCDVSVRLLRVASILSAQDGTSEQIIQARLDANVMPFQDGSLDAVIFCRALHHFQDLYTILAEAHRVLRPGGRLLLLCEPVGHAYDAYTVSLIERNVNEQVFPVGVYEAVASQCGFTLDAATLDWGFSFKGSFWKVEDPGQVGSA